MSLHFTKDMVIYKCMCKHINTKNVYKFERIRIRIRLNLFKRNLDEMEITQIDIYYDFIVEQFVKKVIKISLGDLESQRTSFFCSP